jgi:excinuclease ABC subunit C
VSAGPRDAAARLPAAPGVYRFRDGTGRVVYVGRAGDLRRRVASYWGAAAGHRGLDGMVARVARVEAAVCDSEHEAAWLERNLLERRLPAWNRTPGGQEVPVWIRLDARPGSPGLRTVHLPDPAPGVRHFGPHLGGNRVRLAVAALERVLPLGYTGANLGGTARDLARAHGVGPGDRDRLVRRLAAALEREPAALAAVRGELERRRDRAAAALAFELAARLQAEIDAVGWTLAEQKAALPEAVDLDVHGWAAGVLVGFRVRGGRLCAWTQRACAEAPARARVAATPAAWAAFAQRNAELAARLTAEAPRP